MSRSHSAQRVPPSWQSDKSADACPLCNTRFTWFYRKHHCRSCGRVICHSCCSNFYSLRSDVIARPPSDSPSPSSASAFLATLQTVLAPEEDARDGNGDGGGNGGTEAVRTCDACFSRLEQDRCRRMLGLDISTLDPRVAAQLIRDSTTSPSVLASPPPSYTQTSVHSERLSTSSPADSPRCGRRQEATSGVVGSHGHGHGHIHHHHQQQHHRQPRRRTSTLDAHIVPSTQQTSSSAPASRLLPVPVQPDVVPLRYVSFHLNDHDKMLGEECPICFEEYESGQSIARLECWCVFHLHCIKAWKSQKAGAGGCPLHFHD